MNLKKVPLFAWVLLAILLAILAGQFMPIAVARVFFTFSSLFGAFLGFVIPLIIIGLVTPAIAELGSGSGRWIALTAGIAYVSTMIAGFGTWGVSQFVLPSILTPGSKTDIAGETVEGLTPYFNVSNSASGEGVEIVVTPLMGVMTALVLAFILGLGLSLVQGDVVRRGFQEFRIIIVAMVEKILIPLLPVHIFGIFLNLTMSGEAVRVVTTFLAVVVMTFSLTLVYLLLQYTVAGAFSGRNPLKALWTMKDAYLTALGTSSSAATIPVTLKCTEANGVSKPVAAFTVPLCATIHLSGSTIKIVGFSLAIIFLAGGDMSLAAYAPFIFMLGVMMVAAPGVPGGAIAAAAGLLSSMLGFTEAQVGLMFATYIALDSFGTATNVTGDGAIAMIMDRIAGKKLAESQVK
ncbi:transporter, dicarboxylate/amino acid:cation Na+/H+ symporter family protein [Gleimia coleocanis DSM 15436]|uniref:Transporter, dicarboxylate/amino acid:cation Na+/H+ symporter family protein n=1 Tax=Gleimia coleocanis DSM 15436 TaxID=525245 RepID=C0VZC5_9ACTO|nr:dicarboxylate/amino acid:cation symporter [Gleimia coleocanis]EEH64226.1 transporter, dicarboxylate/amino acid:cation Na+/H+ symporter family protein [Gleimia coleocanis DSM 15436]